MLKKIAFTLTLILSSAITQSDAMFFDRKYHGVSTAEWLSGINSRTPFHWRQLAAVKPRLIRC